MWAVSLTHSLCGQFLLHIPKFMWAASLTHSLCGQFLLHILYVGSFSYTFQGYVGSRFSYTFFMWAVSLTHPMKFMWVVSLTHSLCGQFFLHIPKFMRAVSFTHSLCGQFLLHILYASIFSYTFFMWGFSFTSPMLATLCHGDFLLHISRWLLCVGNFP